MVKLLTHIDGFIPGEIYQLIIGTWFGISKTNFFIKNEKGLIAEVQSDDISHFPNHQSDVAE